MILYKNILQKLKEAGYSTGCIRKEKLLSDSTLTKLRNNKSITMTTLNNICRLLHCTPADIIEYIPDEDFNSSDQMNDNRNDSYKEPVLTTPEQQKEDIQKLIALLVEKGIPVPDELIDRYILRASETK